MGNYVIGVGNSMIVSPSELGNYLIADIQRSAVVEVGHMDLHLMGDWRLID